MIILGVDLETGNSFSDEDVSQNWITELGAVLWDTELGMPVAMMNKLIFPSGREIAKEASEYTGITQDMLDTWGSSVEEVFMEFNKMWKFADFVMAHNGNGFDKPIIENHISKGFTEMEWPERIWIDSKVDIEYPWNCVQKNLTYLSAFHQCWNSWPHRAIGDVLTMLAVASKYDWNRIVEVAQSPQVRVRAVTKAPNWNCEASMKEFNAVKDKIKQAGFRWDPIAKTWELESKKLLVENQSKDWEFNWKIIEGVNNDQF